MASLLWFFLGFYTFFFTYYVFSAGAVSPMILNINVLFKGKCQLLVIQKKILHSGLGLMIIDSNKKPRLEIDGFWILCYRTQINMMHIHGAYHLQRETEGHPHIICVATPLLLQVWKSLVYLFACCESIIILPFIIKEMGIASTLASIQFLCRWLVVQLAIEGTF